jgi:hypothetical protein
MIEAAGIGTGDGVRGRAARACCGVMGQLRRPSLHRAQAGAGRSGLRAAGAPGHSNIEVIEGDAAAAGRAGAPFDAIWERRAAATCPMPDRAAGRGRASGKAGRRPRCWRRNWSNDKSENIDCGVKPWEVRFVPLIGEQAWRGDYRPLRPTACFAAGFGFQEMSNPVAILLGSSSSSPSVENASQSGGVDAILSDQNVEKHFPHRETGLLRFTHCLQETPCQIARDC